MTFSHLTGILLLVLLVAQGCKSSEEFTGFSYDPEGVAETATKKIQPQYKHAFGITSNGIWLSNEFDGARLNNFYQLNDTLYQAVISPENAPINNSPWYAFKAWADHDTTVWIQLYYKDGDHRYIPKLSRNKTDWTPIDADNYRVNSQNGTAQLRLPLNEDTLWVSGQELRTQDWFNQWADSMVQQSFIEQKTIGYSHQDRPIQRLTITETAESENRGVVIIIGRLHPPEVTGNMACIAFMEELASDSELANRFRRQFEVIAYPFANPDGVENGHWRHNAGGVDLNRDWINFNQPEPRAIQDDLLELLEDNPNTKVYYGLDFHSTNENIFYPINRDIETFPEDFTYQWVDELINAYSDTEFTVEPFDTRSPITKNWIYKTFGADAVTYEVDDNANRQKLREISRKSAQVIMRGLLEERSNNGR